MKYYITNKRNVANALIELLNTEVIDAMNKNAYMVERVNEGYPNKKFKVYDENDVFIGYVRILQSNRITSRYSDIIEHPNGTQFAIPIVDITYYNIESKIRNTVMQHGYIHDGDLPNDWFEEII
jgi:hypothetical protein